jgi:hypothetical protein
MTNAVRRTKPSSIVLSGKDESGKPIKTRERISWAILGAMLILIGAAQLLSYGSKEEKTRSLGRLRLSPTFDLLNSVLRLS